MDQQFLAALEETLKAVTLPDSAAIKQASQKLSTDFYSNPLALPSLIHILQNNQDAQLKQLAAVEARKLVSSQWVSTDAALKQQIRDSMLQTAFNEDSKLLRHASARVVAAIGEIDLSEEEPQWPELLTGLVAASNNSNVQSKEMAIYILFTLLETNIPELSKHINDFLSLFGTTLVDQDSRDIRVTSLLALDVVSNYIEDEEITDSVAQRFQNLIPAMVEVLKEVITADDNESTKQIFNVFNNFILIDSKLVGNNLLSLIKFILQIALNTQLDEEYRAFALQFLISAVSLRKSKIVSYKLGPEITVAALKISSEEIDVDDELNNENTENENEENSPPNLGLRLLSMLSAELPPSQVVNPVFEQLPALLSSSNQFEKRAGLLSIGCISAGAPDYLSTQITKLIPALVQGLKDSELIVRVSALRSISQLTSELQDIIASYHESLLPLIIEIIDSATNVMVYKYACYALDGLIEYMNYEAIIVYLEPLMNKLFHMLQSTESSSLQTAIVSAIGSTAYAAGRAFIPYFNKSVESLEPFIHNSAVTEGLSEDDIELRACTFENVSTMARAVGSESFSSYAKPLVEAAYTSINSDNSRLRESGFAFISNMAKVYGEEFAPFLDNIVPEIFKCLEQEELSLDFDEENDDFNDEEDLENKFTVHTGITIEKEIASIALAELAAGTKEAFAKYVEPSIKVLSAQIDNLYGMREAALNAIWKIVIAMYKTQNIENYPIGAPSGSYVDASILALITEARELSITNLEEEVELTMVACILDNLSDAIKAIGPISVIDNGASEHLESLCAQLMNVLKNEHPCQIDDDEAPKDEDVEDASESDALLFESALEVLVNLSTALGPDFNRIFGSFKDVILAHIKSKSKSKRVISIGALAEIAAGIKESNPYTEELLNIFTEKLSSDKSLEVKGNAAYGIGILIEFSSVDVSSAYPTILQLLSKLLNKADRKADTDDEETKDVINRSFANACGCVSRMTLKHQNAVPLDHILPALISHLPLQTGFEENAPIFKLILSLYEQNNEIIISQTEQIVSIFAYVFSKEQETINLEKESTLGREENIDSLKQFQKGDLKAKVIEFLKYVDGKFNGIVSANEVLKTVIA